MAVAKIPNDIFQYASTGALQAGYSEHGPIVAHLPNYGSHGLGVFSHSDDELFFIGSKAYRVTTDNAIDSHNPVKEAEPTAGLAFVMVCNFVPEYVISVTGQLEKDALLDVFSSEGDEAGGKNSMIPFRVRGEFARIKLKTISSARRRGSLLAGGGQRTETKGGDELTDVKGTIFGFIGPEWFAGVSVTGVHCCFLSEKSEDGKHYGGSFVDFQAKGEVEVSWAVTGRFHMGFPRSKVYEDLEITNKIRGN